MAARACDWRVNGALALPLQVHIVHEGGQLYAAGPVRDSVAVASGCVLTRTRHAVGSGGAPAGEHGRASGAQPRAPGALVALQARPAAAAADRDGAAFFGRAAVEWPAWRAHLIDVARRRLHQGRRGSELSVAPPQTARAIAASGTTPRSASRARSSPARGTLLEASFRYHRIEDHYEYSYRVLARVRVAGALK